MCREICDGAGLGICNGAPSTASSYLLSRSLFRREAKTILPSMKCKPYPLKVTKINLNHLSVLWQNVNVLAVEENWFIVAYPILVWRPPKG